MFFRIKLYYLNATCLVIFVFFFRFYATIMDLSKIKESNLIHLCFAITFFTSGLIINFVQCILYIFLRPFNKYIYRKINYYLCASFYARKYVLIFNIEKFLLFFLIYRSRISCGMVVRYRNINLY